MHPTVAEDMRNLDIGALRASFFDMPSDPFILQMQQQQQMEHMQPQDMQGLEYTSDGMYSHQQPGGYNYQGVGVGGGGGCLPSEQPGNPRDMTPLTGAYGQPPMLDATWHSFVEQLGF